MKQQVVYLPENITQSNLVIEDKNTKTIFKAPNKMIIKKIFGKTNDIMLGYSSNIRTLGVFPKNFMNQMYSMHPDFVDPVEDPEDNESENSESESESNSEDRDKLFDVLTDPTIEKGTLIIHFKTKS